MADIDAARFAIVPKEEYGSDKFFEEYDTYDMVHQSKSIAGKKLTTWRNHDARYDEVVQFRDDVKSNPYNRVVVIGALGQNIYSDFSMAFGGLYSPILHIKAMELTRLIRSEIHRTLSLGFDPSERMRAFAEGLHNENNLRESLTEHVLSWPTLDADDVYRRLSADAEPYRLRSELIGLPVDGQFVYPEFQFHPAATHLRAEIKVVNQELDAVTDPWGAADWWLSENEWLDAKPVDLLEHRSGYSKLVAAVRAATEEI